MEWRVQTAALATIRPALVVDRSRICGSTFSAYRRVCVLGEFGAHVAELAEQHQVPTFRFTHTSRMRSATLIRVASDHVAEIEDVLPIPRRAHAAAAGRRGGAALGRQRHLRLHFGANGGFGLIAGWRGPLGIHMQAAPVEVILPGSL